MPLLRTHKPEHSEAEATSTPALQVKTVSSQINDACFFEENSQAVTIGNDGFLKQVDYLSNTLQKSFKVSEYALSCLQVIKEPNYIAVNPS